MEPSQVSIQRVTVITVFRTDLETAADILVSDTPSKPLPDHKLPIRTAWNNRIR